MKKVILLLGLLSVGSMAQTPAAAPVLDLSAQYLDSKTTSHCYSQQQAKYFLPTVPVIAGEFSSWQQLAHKCRSDLQARQDLVNTTKTKLQILVGKPDPCQLKVLSAQLANEAAIAAALALLCQGRVEKEILTAMKKKSDAQAWVELYPSSAPQKAHSQSLLINSCGNTLVDYVVAHASVSSLVHKYGVEAKKFEAIKAQAASNIPNAEAMCGAKSSTPESSPASNDPSKLTASLPSTPPNVQTAGASNPYAGQQPQQAPQQNPFAPQASSSSSSSSSSSPSRRNSQKSSSSSSPAELAAAPAPKTPLTPATKDVGSILQELGRVHITQSSSSSSSSTASKSSSSSSSVTRVDDCGRGQCESTRAAAGVNLDEEDTSHLSAESCPKGKQWDFAAKLCL